MSTPRALRIGVVVLGCAAWSALLSGCPKASVPTVSSTGPADGAIGVSISTKITATFSEAMDPATITMATFTLTRGTTSVSGTVAYAGVTAKFSPTSSLAPNTVYTAAITAGATDLSGEKLASDYVWTFTTGAAPDTTAPSVSSTAPANGTASVPLGVNLAATFSETMDSSTINTATFTLMRGTTPVPGMVTYTGVTAILRPTSDLEPHTLYTATIRAGAADLSGNTLAQDLVWTFTTGADPDTTAPVVSYTVPVIGRSDVPINASLAVTLSEAMNPLTITTATFTLAQGAGPVSGTVAYAGVTATFSPTSGLAPNTLHTAKIADEAKDLAGNPLREDFEWTFTTGVAPDTLEPLVSSTFPVNGAAAVPLGVNLAVTFSEPMDPLTIASTTFTLDDGTTGISGTVTYTGVTAIFNPTSGLASNTLYTATIRAEATDLARNPLREDFVWTFTTGAAPDTTAPLVSYTVPANGSIGVPLGRDLTVTFTEAMNPLTITTATFTLAQGTTPVSGTVTYVGVTAIFFNPTSDLTPNTLYTATIANEAKDLAGNPLREDFEWTFTTGAAPDTLEPLVSSTVPVNGTTGVPLGVNLAATFSEAMDPLTITSTTFTLDDGTTGISGTVTYSGVTANFSPTNGLAPNTLYTATIRAEAEDLAGNPMREDFVWTFTTGAVPDTTAPGVSSTAPAKALGGVPIDAGLAVTFTEAMNPLTITAATFTLDEEAVGPVSGTVTCTGVTAIFNPAYALEPYAAYTATITAGAVDLAGNALTEDFVWVFTTGADPDYNAPWVSATIPAHGTTGMPPNADLIATFSESMDPLTITTATFILDDGSAAVSGTVTYTGVTAIFNPTRDLEPNTEYTATIVAGPADLSENLLLEDFVWTFTTGAAPDTAPPLVNSTIPEDGSTGVSNGANLAVTFSEVMDPLTTTTATLTLARGTAPVPGTVTYAGATVIFNPTDFLVPRTVYTATITAGVADLSGNATAEDFVWTFTVGEVLDTNAPEVSSTAPDGGITGMPLGGNLAATFSEAMDWR